MTQGTVQNEQKTIVKAIHSYQDLLVWEKGFRLALDIYKLTQAFPPSELYGMVNQMRRAAYSVPTNLAEGYRRPRKEFGRFISIALGSASELETFLLMSRELGYGDSGVITTYLEKIDEILRMLHSLRKSLNIAR